MIWNRTKNTKVYGDDHPADLEKQLAKATKRVTNATSLLIEDPSDAEARRLRDEARAELRRIQAQLADVGAPVTLPSNEGIVGGLRRLLDCSPTSPGSGTRRSFGAVCGYALR